MSRLRFQEDAHVYTLDGVVIPSNTQVLTAEGLIDKTFYSEDGRERGTRVHAACWFADEGKLDWDTVAEDERGYIRAFEKFKRESEWITDFNELPVWGSPGFGTRLDLLGVGVFKVGDTFLRRRAVVDIKTGVVPPWVGLQTAGQKMAVVERIQAQDEAWSAHLEYINGHPYPELRFALKLNRNGTYRLKEFNDPAEEPIFSGYVHAHHWKKRNRL